MTDIDAVVIGGGPAGSAIGRLLASWGHGVRILAKPCDRSRGLGESLPPSTRKLLDAIDALAAVDRAGFYRTTGNTVWWASRERRVETFDPAGRVFGYQVFRPDFDRVLLESAASTGVEMIEATVRRVQLRESGLTGPGTSNATAVAQPSSAAEDLAHVEYEHNGRRDTVACRFVIDCSGRAGVVAKPHRRPEPNHRMYALVGQWKANGECNAKASAERQHLSDETHTIVETYEDGWAWSVPISRSTRHVGTMIDGTSPRVTSGRALGDAYRAEIAKTIEVARMLEDAALQHVFACDASLYSSETYAGSQFLLVGDAGSFIDPLSSFGVKKALASAWLGAVVVHTCLTHPDRQTVAVDFFTRWERDVYATHLRRSRDFARAAHARHPHPFWARRAETEVRESADLDEAALMHDGQVQAAFDRLKESADVELTLAGNVPFVPQPVIRGREIVLEDAIGTAGLKALGATKRHEREGGCTPGAAVAQPFRAAGIRFLNNVDLVTLAELARQYHRVPDLFEAYCRVHGSVPLPNVLVALSFLVANGILAQRV